jgi:hypothetical protein
MAKKVKYNLGDIVKLPLKNDTYGFGRILLMKSPAIFVGFYDVISNDEIDISMLKNKKYILKIKCGDVGIKRNEWNIIGNIPIEEEFSLPYFWDKNGLTGELYIRRYKTTKDNPLAIGADFEDKPTTDEEIKEKKAQPDGAFGWKAAEAVLKHYLEKAGIL